MKSRHSTLLKCKSTATNTINSLNSSVKRRVGYHRPSGAIPAILQWSTVSTLIDLITIQGPRLYARSQRERSRQPLVWWMRPGYLQEIIFKNKINTLVCHVCWTSTKERCAVKAPNFFHQSKLINKKRARALIITRITNCLSWKVLLLRPVKPVLA